MRDIAEARILVIDDEPINIELMRELLDEAGYRSVRTTTRSAEAVDLFLEFDPDIVLLDLHMPAPDGFEVMRQLTALIDPDSYVPILMLTADGTDRVKQRALAEGAKDFLTKPFGITEILLRLQNLLEARMLHVELQQRNQSLTEVVRTHQAAEAEHHRRLDEISARTRAVLEGTGLTMHFQPIVDLATGELRGAEALARFEGEPKRPDLWFIEAAEVGLALDLELTAIGAALDAASHLPPGTFLSLNASADTVCADKLHDLLGSHPDVEVVLELTEHERVEDYTRLDAAMARLRALGVRLAVDDTGSGFASLQHILRLEPDIIKLDRYLINGIDHDPARRSLAAALVGFSREIGAHLVAEGIETEVELEALTDLCVSLGQGYFIARPAPLPVALESLVR